MAMVKKAVAYYRVSTERQGRSGLGIEAQRDAVTRFAASEGWTIVAEHVEQWKARRLAASER
jgi:DNA invertase Pin-like site-specific DNA recombinase